MINYKEYDAVLFNNLKEMLKNSVEQYKDNNAFLEKKDGVYTGVKYAQFGRDVDALGTALLAHGVKHQHVIVIGENCYAWALSYLTVVNGVGAIVPVDKELDAEEVANIAVTSKATAVFYSEKVKEKIDVLPDSMVKITFDEIGAWIDEGEKLLADGNRDYLDAEIDNDVMAVLLFTSGTTGQSKGVMLSHRNLCRTLFSMKRMFPVNEYDVFLSVLPMHHTYECSCGFLCPFSVGATVAFSEGVRYMARNLQEIKPTYMLSVPMILENVYQKIWNNIKKSGNELLVRNMIVATNLIPMPDARRDAKRKAFASVYDFFGGNIEFLIVGGAAIDPKVLKGLCDFGLTAIQGYGLTECAPIAAINTYSNHKAESAGLCPPDCELNIDNPGAGGIGEIRYRGDNVMLGYYERPDLTEEVIHDGWLYTGDLGYIDPFGYLMITGRKKNVIVTYNGKNIFPEELETYLCRSPYVAEAVIVAYMNDKRKDYDLVALLCPDEAKFIETYGRDYTDEQVDKEFTKALADVNRKTQTYKRIQYFVNVHEPFPKNSSRKILRMGLNEKYYPDYEKKLNS